MKPPRKTSPRAKPGRVPAPRRGALARLEAVLPAGLRDRRPAGAAASAPIIPAASVQGRALVLVVAIMSYLACLTVGAVALVHDAASSWRSDVSREVTIQIRPSDGADMGAAVDRAVALAEAMPGVGRVSALSAAETKALLEPWLGSGVDLEALPVPRLVSVELAEPGRADLAKLAADLARDVKGASLDDHSAWSARLSSMASSVVLGGFAVLALVLLAMALSVVFATRAAMASNRQVVEVLHFVGAENAFVSREFERHFLMVGLKGGFAGGLAAVVTFLAIGLAQRGAAGTAEAEQANAFLGGASLGAVGYLGCLGIVVLVAVVTATTSRLAVHRHLATLS
jgi:cell division transport system permease protein